MIFQVLKEWAPFRIDALGLVTLLGASEVDLAVGRLARSRWTGFLPLLGAFTVAGNNMARPIPSFTVYNITDGIMCTDIPGWFARWLLCQDVEWNTTNFLIQFQPKRKDNPVIRDLLMYGVGLMTMGLPMALSILIGDWWGVSNWVSMIVSAVVRRIVVDQNRKGLELAAREAERSPDEVVSFWTLPTGHAVTIRCPRGILIKCLLTEPVPPRKDLYLAARIAGWIAFGFHVITLGMACLLNQILSVICLLVATLLVVHGIGEDDYSVCPSIWIGREDVGGAKERGAAYARLDLTPQEEE
jgi:hypothetical protein